MATYSTSKDGSLTIKVPSGHSEPLRIITNGASRNVSFGASGAGTSHNAISRYDEFASRSSHEPEKLKKKSKRHNEREIDVLDIYVEGELEGNVPVYDDCNVVRRKIQAYLREPGKTQAAFARQVGKCFPDRRTIQSKQVNDFLRKKGATAGAECGLYYAAYVFFEKMRIKEDKAKSKARLESECDFPYGRELKERRHMWVVVPKRRRH